MTKTPPLNGIKVIDQTQALAGPFCTMMLGDMGADVIKIERPGIGDQSRHWAPPFIGDQSAYYLGANRNKRSIALDIQHESGRELMHQMISTADIFITNLATQEALAKYGLDPVTLQALNPRLIYTSISGYGRTGPRAGQPGYDMVAQAESGTISLTGEPNGIPMRFPTALADMTCGVYTLIGILTALYTRTQNGIGQVLDMSLQEGQITWLQNAAGAYFATGEEPARQGNRHPQVVPYEAVQGAEGDWFILGVGSDNVWRAFCTFIQRGDLLADSRFTTNTLRVQNYNVLLPIIRQIIKSRPTETWLKDLRAVGVPCGRINTVTQALNDPHLLERGMIIELEHPVLGMVKSIASPIHLSDTPLVYHRHPPMLGEHTDEILTELGRSADQIGQLRAAQVVG